MPEGGCPVKKHLPFTREFKLEAVRLLESSGNPAAELARELGVRRNQLYKWQEQLSAKGKGNMFPGHGQRAGSDAEVAHLKRKNECLRERRLCE